MNSFIPLAKPFFPPGTIDELSRVVESGWIVQGQKVEEFENSLARMHGMEFGIAVTSATAGLHLALLSLELNSGSPCFIPSFAWPSAANMSEQCGYYPIFTDVDERSYNMSAQDLEDAVDKYKQNSGNKSFSGAVVIIHEFGNPAIISDLCQVARKHGLKVIEDAACALGSHYENKPIGQSGICSVFSFHPRKSITTGEGGCILTNDSHLAENLRALRNHGQSITPDGNRAFISPGFNYRLTEFQASMGLSQLQCFPDILSRRKALVQRYLKNLENCPGISLPPFHDGHSWQTFMIVLHDNIDRNVVTRKLKDLGVGAGPGSVSGHELGYFQQKYSLNPTSLPISHRLNHQGLALPLFHELKFENVDYVSDSLRKILSSQ